MIMQMYQRRFQQLIRNPVLLVGLFVLSIILASMWSQQTNALTNVGPDPADFTGGIRYVLEDTPQVRVTSSIVPIYSPYDPGTIQVTAYSFKFENRPSPHAQVRFSYTNSGGGTSNTVLQSDGTMNVSGFQYDPNTGYYYTLMTATIINNGSSYPVINYRLTAPSPIIFGYYAANDNNFAVENDRRDDAFDSSGAGEYHTYRIPFGTQCQAQGDTTAVARIYDGDNGNLGVQPTPFNVSIYNETDGTTQRPAPSPSNGEQDGQTASYSFTVKPYNKYRFVVSNVYANNVMQIKLPYDSIYYYSDCRQLEITDRMYGSWGEYAVSATGIIKGIGSGSAFAGKGLSYTTLCSYSFLILSNATTSGTNCKSTATLGSYNPNRTIPDVAATFPQAAATNSVSGNVDIGSLSGTYTASGPVNLTGGTLPVGRWAVINATGQSVTITGDLNYAPASMTSLDQIPQLIIIADNINIQSNVLKVDAWLITKGTLNTCSDVAKANINATNCNNLLVVNGPVMAGRLLLYRTAGSGNGDLSGEPAEIFNLRPDAYLWGITHASTNGRIETVYQRELPPRF
ncbi:MAG: hypothetical protein WAO28_03360 [Candidatus Microsaccharimonas sp.]